MIDECSEHLQTLMGQCLSCCCHVKYRRWQHQRSPSSLFQLYNVDAVIAELQTRYPAAPGGRQAIQSQSDYPVLQVTEAEVRAAIKSFSLDQLVSWVAFICYTFKT
jgi:hypothetical protein